MNINASPYNEGLRQVALQLILHARELVELPPYAEKGVRFYHNDGVLWRLESARSEDDFVLDPVAAVFGALIDAAQSDYWYSHEKEWGHPEYFDDVDEEDIMEVEGC